MMQGIAEVNNFINKLHSREYMIEPRASEIPYTENRSLAVELGQALNDFSFMYRAIIAPDPIVTQRAFNAITATFALGLVVDRNDIRKKLREAEELLARCEDDESRLERDNNELRQELISCQQIKERLQELLAKAQTGDNGVV